MLKHKKLALIVLLIVGLVLLFKSTGLSQYFTLTALQTVIHQYPVWGLCVFVGLFCIGNLVQVPGWIFLAAAVLALGQVVGGVVTYIAAVTSCAFTFLSIRFIGGSALRNLTQPWAVYLLNKLDVQPLLSVTLLRTCLQTAPALNYTLALSGVRFKHYMLGTMIGLPLPIFLYCLFFDLLAKMLPIT